MLGLSLKFDEGETVAKIGLAAMAAPWQCYAEAWGVGSKSAPGTPPNPLEAGIGAIFNMTDKQIQEQINDALRQYIY